MRKANPLIKMKNHKEICMEMSFAPCLWYWQAYLEELHAWDNFACDIEGDLQTWSDKRPFLAFFYFVVNSNSSVCMIVISNITSLDGQISGSGYEKWWLCRPSIWNIQFLHNALPLLQQRDQNICTGHPQFCSVVSSSRAGFRAKRLLNSPSTFPLWMK